MAVPGLRHRLRLVGLQVPREASRAAFLAGHGKPHWLGAARADTVERDVIGALVTVGVILAFWMTGGVLYRWTWGHWLQVWAWPSALGFCLLGKRAARWESGYTRPFLVGRLYDKDNKPGPYLNGDVPLADLRRLVTGSRTDKQPHPDVTAPTAHSQSSGSGVHAANKFPAKDDQDAVSRPPVAPAPLPE